MLLTCYSAEDSQPLTIKKITNSKCPIVQTLGNFALNISNQLKSRLLPSSYPGGEDLVCGGEATPKLKLYALLGEAF